MRFALLMALSMPVLADGLYWNPVTTTVDGRPLPVAPTYQIYRDGVAYGVPITVAPTPAKMVSVPSCDNSTYYVTASAGGKESAPSNTQSAADCFPAAPEIDKVETAQLTACRVDNAKLTLAKMAAESSLRACQAKGAAK